MVLFAAACCYPQHTVLVQRRLSSLAENKECSVRIMCLVWLLLLLLSVSSFDAGYLATSLLLLQRVSEKVLCVLCDARFGTGALESKGNPVICPRLCQEW